MLTVIILTKNEEKNIEACLETLSFADEKLLIDDFSTDKTVFLAKRLGVKILRHESKGDFSSARNWAMLKAKYEWILFVDADERVSSNLAEEIKKAISKNEYDGYFIRRIDTMWRRKLMHGDTGNTYILRLGKKNQGQWTGRVHEIWSIEGKIGYLDHSLDHYPHPTVGEFLETINYYSDLRAKELYDAGVKSSWWEILLYTKAKYIKLYIIKLGFLDGVPGMMHALIMSFYSFLVRGKLYQLWRKR